MYCFWCLELLLWCWTHYLYIHLIGIILVADNFISLWLPFSGPNVSCMNMLTYFRNKIIDWLIDTVCRPTTVGNTQLAIGRRATNLGVHLDSEMTMLPNIQNVCEGCYYQLHQLRSVRRALHTDVTKSLMQSLICTRVNYCNSVLTGASTTNIRRLQSVVNSAARSVARRSKFDHIKDFIRDELHWLPVQHRIQYKLVLQVYKCLHNTAHTSTDIVGQCSQMRDVLVFVQDRMDN